MERAEQLWRDLREEVKRKDWRLLGPSSAVLFSSFYMLQMVSQRAFGVIGLHSAVSTGILAPLGCCATVANLYISQVAEGRARELTHDYTFEEKHPIFKFFSSPAESERDKQRRLALSVGMYVLMERGLFRTTFPSSVIAIGSFGNLFNKFRYSIPATLDITTESQRAKIQALGRRFGCHQCGSRQMGLQTFIADHMPPSRFAKDAAAVWWRRLFKVAVDQRLWPQCQKCYSLQGSAVRTDTHKLVYHSVIKPFHFSSALAFLAMQHPLVSKEIQQLVDPCVDHCTELFSKLLDLVPK